MGLFDRFRKAPEIDYRPSKALKRSFAAAKNSNSFDGWTTTTASIDSFLRTQLPVMRARSREQVMNNPLMKRAVGLQSKNIVGNKGITVHPKVIGRGGDLDKPANKALKLAFEDWATNHCDYAGQLSWVEMQDLWIKTAATDGSYIYRTRNSGKYGLQIENIDPELLDITRNQLEAGGNTTRLGVEYSGPSVVAYWFRALDAFGNYNSGRTTRIPASEITHCFRMEWPNQSQGIPWSYASLTRLKHLDAYDESALIAARAGSSKMGFIKGSDDDDDNGTPPLMDFDPGTITKLGEDEEFIGFDPAYPNDAYVPFTKKGQRDVGAGMDISYASLSGDMSDVNYSSIRYGGQDEREGFIDKQNWMIRCSTRPIYEEWVRNAVLRGLVKIGNNPLSRPVTDYYPAHFQGRRWQSTDPQKEAKGHASDLENKLTSPQRIITARGDDPDEILAELREWQALTGGMNEQEETQ